MSVLHLDKLPGRQRNRPIRDWTGEKFGRLLALKLVNRSADNNHLWQFQCDCGTIITRKIKLVRSGHTHSCGCLARETLANRNTTHGLSQRHKATYRTWKDMRARCNNPKNWDYANYGGRGIVVCARWDDFANFFADMGERPDGLTIDRINTNGPYSPDNCRWATPETQANNKRTNTRVTINGETKTLQQWANASGVDRTKLKYRLKVGYSATEALSQEDLRLVRNS